MGLLDFLKGAFSTKPQTDEQWIRQTAKKISEYKRWKERLRHLPIEMKKYTMMRQAHPREAGFWGKKLFEADKEEKMAQTRLRIISHQMTYVPARIRAEAERLTEQ